jgi:hypothetical protein
MVLRRGQYDQPGACPLAPGQPSTRNPRQAESVECPELEFLGFFVRLNEDVPVCGYVFIGYPVPVKHRVNANEQSVFGRENPLQAALADIRDPCLLGPHNPAIRPNNDAVGLPGLVLKPVLMSPRLLVSVRLFRLVTAQGSFALVVKV